MRVKGRKGSSKFFMRNRGYHDVHGVHLRASAEQRCGEIRAVGGSLWQCMEAD